MTSHENQVIRLTSYNIQKYIFDFEWTSKGGFWMWNKKKNKTLYGSIRVKKSSRVLTRDSKIEKFVWNSTDIHTCSMHSNQWDSFILYRQQITSNGFFSCLPKWAKTGVWVTEKDFEIKKLKLYVSFLYNTNRFHVAVRLFSNRSQRTLKCGKNIIYTLGYRLVCQVFVLFTFWCHLWSITEQTYGNMKSIC